MNEPHASPADRIYVFGSGVRARLLWDIVQWEFAEQWAIAGYFDDFRPAGSLGPGLLPVLGDFQSGLKYLGERREAAFVATGTTRSIVRCELLCKLIDRQIRTPSLIPPSANVSLSARIGHGSLLMPGAFIGTEARIGHLFCAHGGTIVEHDCRIGHNVMLGPGVTLAGGCAIGNCCFLGAGVSVAPNVTIGKGTLVGTGSVVIRDLPDHVIAYGHPAEPQRDVRVGDEVPAASEFTLLTADQWQQLEQFPLTN